MVLVTIDKWNLPGFETGKSTNDGVRAMIQTQASKGYPARYEIGSRHQIFEQIYIYMLYI